MKTYKHVFVHYGPAGEILQASEGTWPHERESLSCAIITDVTLADILQAVYKVDLTSVGMGEDGWNRAKVIKVAEHDTSLKLFDLMVIRNRELNATDQYMVEDRPITPQEKQAWKNYRKALRDLGQYLTVDDAMQAWPRRPNNSDAVEHLRKK
jgi:hypothetical protein